MTGYRISAASVFEFGGRTDADGNPHQEDALAPAPADLSADTRLFVLCDGMGGHDAGEVASDTVCRAIAASVADSCPGDSAVFTGDMLQKAISDAYDALDGVDTGAVKKMGTTMTMLKFHAGGVTAAHIGDSRIYHLRTAPGRPASVVHVTVDHSLVNDLVKIGELTPEEAAVHPRRNVLSRAMQPHLEYRYKASVYETDDVRPGDIFYLCSDGMLEQMDDDGLCRVFTADADGRVDVDAVATALREATKDNRDNHSAFIIRVDAVPARCGDSKDEPEAALKIDAKANAKAKAKVVSRVRVPQLRRRSPRRRAVSRGGHYDITSYILFGAAAAVLAGLVIYWLL